MRIIVALFLISVLMVSVPSGCTESDLSGATPKLYWMAEAWWDTDVSGIQSPAWEYHRSMNQSLTFNTNKRFLGNMAKSVDLPIDDRFYLKYSAIQGLFYYDRFKREKTILGDGEWLIGSDTREGYMTYDYLSAWNDDYRFSVFWTHEGGKKETIGEFSAGRPCNVLLYQDDTLYCVAWDDPEAENQFSGQLVVAHYAKWILADSNTVKQYQADLFSMWGIEPDGMYYFNRDSSIVEGVAGEFFETYSEDSAHCRAFTNCFAMGIGCDFLYADPDTPFEELITPAFVVAHYNELVFVQ